MTTIQKHRKLAVMGIRGVGKTSLISQYVKNPGSEFREMYTPTIEDTFYKTVHIDGKEFKCEIVDTAGQDEFTILQSKHFIGVHGYLIVFSVLSLSTLATARAIINKILTDLDDGAPSSPDSRTDARTTIVLAANKCDQQQNRQVDEAAIRKLADEFNCPWFVTSARDGTNVDKTFESLLTEVEKLQNPPEAASGSKCFMM